MRKIARVGDRTSHGGRVITGSKKRKVGGRFVARKGDKCSCPVHGRTTIVTITSKMPYTDGRLTAHAGAKTGCGARLLSGTHRNYEGRGK